MANTVVTIQVFFEKCIEQNVMPNRKDAPCNPSKLWRPYHENRFFKTAERILDDISNCCNSTTKELTLEALSCWRIWLENQLIEDWKQNKTCYFAVRPLLTVKYHPLHKDDEIIEMKLSLMWLALNKIQHLIQLEGPQHILEVFIQSCVSWLSCAEDLLPKTSNLILKLLNALFTKDVPNFDQKGSFPPLEAYVLQSNKLFSRLLPSFIEIFHNWGKIKEKTDLLSIWNHFLGHCEQSFKFIPVSSWHKIFKLVENICGDDKETIENKLFVLHKCATVSVGKELLLLHSVIEKGIMKCYGEESLKSVMYNSKFIDCSQLLTTPAEALLKLAIELSINSAKEKKSFEMFRYCHEICHVLSNQIIHTLGYEACTYILPKLEEISSKSLHWGLWCGLANCFKDEMKNVEFDQYNAEELKIFKKLRSVAVNFDLDRSDLEENSILMIESQLNFLRIGINCKNCSICIGKTADLTLSQENQQSLYECNTSVETFKKEEIFQCEGHFGFNIVINPKFSISHDKKIVHFLPLLSKNFEEHSFVIVKEEFGSTPNDLYKILLVQNLKDQSWLRCNFSFKNLDMCNFLFLRAERVEKLNLLRCNARRSFAFAPAYITVVLQEIIKKTQESSDSSCDNLIENVKKFQNKLSRCRFFTPIKFCVSLEGAEGVKFCRDILRYWEDIEDIVHDVDFVKNLNNLMTKNDNWMVCFCMFALLVNFTFNLVVEHSENYSCGLKKFYVAEGTALSRKITNFTKKVVDHKQRLSKSDFIESVSKILPRNDDNPLVLWSKNNLADEMNKDGKRKKSMFQGLSNEDACASVPNDIAIFNYFDELQNKSSSGFNSSSTVNSTGGRKRKHCSDEAGKSSQNTTVPNVVDVTPRPNLACGKIWENKNVKVIVAPPDVFRSLKLSELASDIDPKECITCDRNLEVKNYFLERFERDEWNYPSENELPARRRKLCFDVEPGLNCDEAAKDETPVRKCKANKMVGPSSKTKENRPVPSKEPYFLRRRPLKLPHKFKGEKNLFGQKKRETKPKKVTPTKNRNKVSDDISTIEKVLPDNADMTITSDSCSPDAGPPAVTDVESVEEGIIDNGSVDKIDVEVTSTESDVIAEGSDIFGVCSIAEDVNKCEPEKDEIQNTRSNKMDVNTDGECQIGAISSPVTTRKRLGSSIDESTCRKKLKLDSDACEESAEVITLKSTEAKSDVCPDKESIDSEDASKKINAEAENVCKKSAVSVVQSRASKMFALLSEPPRIEHFYETSPSSKQQSLKPHVNKNSRASKMLALLPEMQDVCSNLEGDHVEEPGDRAKEENARKETSGHVTGKTHHLSRSINNIIITGSPNRSPMRQRKSIRFDDDKNETVTYFTDSPPCLLRGELARGLSK